jgi:CRISPR-associated endonuclease Csn1
MNTQINNPQNTMVRNLRYRLALDIGTTSLGWCILRINPNNEPYAIVKMGVRIFSDGRVPKSGESLAVTRRTARLQRRRRDRLLKRKAQMERKLIDFNFWPINMKERLALAALDPYILRAKGLDALLTPAEFGRAIFHLNQRRGFKSNRKTDQSTTNNSHKDSDTGALKGAITTLKNTLDDQGLRTVGEYLYQRHLKREGTRARPRNTGKKDTSYDLYIDRAMIETEFDTLWHTQARINQEENTSNATLYTLDAYTQLKDVLLFQRPLKPTQAGRCTLIPNEKRAPQALPSTQHFRMLQELNNLRYLNDDLSSSALTLAQRNIVFETLQTTSRLTFKAIIKLLKLPKDTSFNLEEGKRDHLKGNLTAINLHSDNAFGTRWNTFDSHFQDSIVNNLLNEENKNTLIQWLIENTHIDEATASRIENKNLPDGYGSLSTAAINRILVPLKASIITYDKAVLAAGFDSHSDLSASRDGEVLNELPYYGKALSRSVGFGTNNPNDSDEKCYGRINNPTVHIGLNQVRRVVNALIKAYGHPSEIILEVTRDLKISKARQNDILKEQKRNQIRNDALVIQACQVLGLNADHIDKSKKRELSQKMQLWQELNFNDSKVRQCPYTGEQICIQTLLSHHVEIEHILPYARTFDDTLHNKTVAMTRANRYKGNRTPFEAFGQSNDGYDYEALLERVKTMPINKRKRFAPDGYEQWLGQEGGNFMARALNDTAYLSKIAREYVALICPARDAVRAIPGRMTALIRGKFGLNHLLSGDETKNRNDHRHHALDAAVIGITDTALLQKFSRANSRAKEQGMTRLLDSLEYPWASYRDHIERGLAGITVSFKPNHSYEGAMHEETAWGLLGNGDVQRRVIKEGDTHRTKIKETKKVIEINSTSKQARTRHGVDQNGVPLPYKGYVGGSNDCIEIWQNDAGKWEGKVITTFEAYQVIRRLGQTVGYKQLRHPTQTQQGKPLVMRLMINDMVRMNIEGVWKIMRITGINSTNNNMSFAPHNEANVAARNLNKIDAFSYTYKAPSSLQKTQAKKITVNEIGVVRR